MHINMEVPQGNSLCSYFETKNIVFFFFFFYIKSENRRVEQVLSGRVGGVVPVGGRSKWGNGERG
jgi:hypothetical protein